MPLGHDDTGVVDAENFVLFMLLNSTEKQDGNLPFRYIGPNGFLVFGGKTAAGTDLRVARSGQKVTR